MKIIQILGEGRVISADLVLSPNQAVLLQQLRSPALVKKLAIEIALAEENVSVIVTAIKTHNTYENSILGFRIADESLASHAWQNSWADQELMASGDVVVVGFQVVRDRLQFDYDSLGLFEDHRGKLHVQRPGHALKK